MTTRRHLLLILLAGVGGVLLGRAVPPGPPSPIGRPLPSLAVRIPDRDCKAERAELSSTRAQLAICMAYGASPPAPEPSAWAAPPPEPDPATPLSAIPAGFQADILQIQRKADPEVVFVLEPIFDDAGSGRTRFYRTRSHRADEWSPDGGVGHLFMQKHADGSIDWYDAPAVVRDLVPGGVIATADGTRIRIRFLSSEAGAARP